MIGNHEVLTCERAMYDNLWQEGQKLSQMAVGYNKKIAVSHDTAISLL